jgi:hypothetical protein
MFMPLWVSRLPYPERRPPQPPKSNDLQLSLRLLLMKMVHNFRNADDTTNAIKKTVVIPKCSEESAVVPHRLPFPP